jgi:hypothetical protein
MLPLRHDSLEFLLFLELDAKALNLEDFFEDKFEPVPETTDEADDEQVELFECLSIRDLLTEAEAASSMDDVETFLTDGILGMTKKLLDDFGFVSFLAEFLPIGLRLEFSTATKASIDGSTV